jgi:hypothetical protein
MAALNGYAAGFVNGALFGHPEVLQDHIYECGHNDPG